MIFYVLSIILCIIFIIYLIRQLFKPIFLARSSISPQSLKSGDLIFFAGDICRYNPNIVSIEHTHCGMIFRDAGCLKIIELTSSGDWPDCNNKPIIHSLQSRIANYHGHINIKSIDEELLISEDILSNFKDVEFDTKYTSNFLKQWLLNVKRKPEKWCCTELIYSLLVHLGELEYDDDDFHDSFRFLSKLKKTKNRTYSDYFNLVFDKNI